MREDLKALLARGRDPVVFFEEILGIPINPAQARWLRLVTPEDGYTWPHKLVIHVAANQIGKTLGVAGLVLWACWNKIGVDVANAQAWLDEPYNFFHVAPTQQQAYIPLTDIKLLIAGNHPAQHKGAELGLKFRLPAGLVTEVKLEQYYDGLRFWNGATCQFRTTEDKAAALQGRRAAAISFDEVGFEDRLTAVVNETLMMRLISTGGPLLMIGTPNGITDYYDFVRGIVDAGSHPGWDADERVWISASGALCWSHITDNVGFGITQAEVDRMEANLDPTTKEQQLRGAFLEPAEAFFVPTQRVLDAFKKYLPDEEPPKPGHSYVIFWDPSMASDPTAVIVLDVTDPIWRGVYMRHYIKPLSFTNLVAEVMGLHGTYQSARRKNQISRSITGYDATGMGGVIVRQALASVHPSRPLNFGGPSTKIDILTNLRAALVEGKLELPATWLPLLRELLNYRLKDEKLRQDLVMALAGATDIAAKGFSGAQRARFDPGVRVMPTWR